MNSETVTLDHLKRHVLPELFQTPSKLGEYGPTANSREGIKQLEKHMEAGSASALADDIAQILSKMSDASPERIARKPKWHERLLGDSVEKKLRYQVARTTLESMLERAEGHAQSVADTVDAIGQLIDSHQHEVVALKLYIQAGREFLDENPLVGAVQAGDMEFDRPRERLARKLANLSTLVASHELSVNQMKLSRAQAVDMLDRFRETVSILVPVWRQHTLTLISTNNMSPAMVEQASKAHQALMASLSSSLDATKH